VENKNRAKHPATPSHERNTDKRTSHRFRFDFDLYFFKKLKLISSEFHDKNRFDVALPANAVNPISPEKGTRGPSPRSSGSRCNRRASPRRRAGGSLRSGPPPAPPSARPMGVLRPSYWASFRGLRPLLSSSLGPSLGRRGPTPSRVPGGGAFGTGPYGPPPARHASRSPPRGPPAAPRLGASRPSPGPAGRASPARSLRLEPPPVAGPRPPPAPFGLPPPSARPGVFAFLFGAGSRRGPSGFFALGGLGSLFPLVRRGPPPEAGLGQPGRLPGVALAGGGAARYGFEP